MEQKYFVFVALENKYPEVIYLFEKCNRKEFRDYIYPSGNPVLLAGNEREYFDLNGNEICGVVDGYHVELSRGSKLVVGKDCKIDKSVLIRLHNNAILVLGEHCRIGPQSIIDCADSVCQIGDNCEIENNFHLFQRSSKIFIGESFFCGPFCKLRVRQNAVCMIERDCMFSEDIRIQCMDGHNYFDLANQKNIGKQKNYVVHVGEHVWIGARSSLLYGADIGAGSIIGMGSFVNKRFPPNVAIAGNPARIIREQVAWSREGYPFIEDGNLFEDYCFTERKPYG